MARDYTFHKRYFSLLKTGFENQSRYSDLKTFRRHILCSIGWLKWVTDDNGNTFPDAGSLSFETCTQSDFELIYSKTVGYFIETLAINQEILSKVMEYEK